MEYSDPKWHWNAPFATPEPTKFLGGTPRPPLKEDVSFAVHFINICIHHRARHCAFPDFLVETHFDPCICKRSPRHHPKHCHLGLFLFGPLLMPDIDRSFHNFRSQSLDLCQFRSRSLGCEAEARLFVLYFNATKHFY